MKEWIIELLLAVGILKPAEPEQFTVTLPCGAEVGLINNGNSYFKICTEDNYDFVSKKWLADYKNWTIPMKEVYLLFIKDFKNFSKNNTVRKDLSVVTTYTHKVLGYSFSTDNTTNMRSLTYQQAYNIHVALKLHKYSNHSLKYKQLKDKQIENRRLRQAKKDAAKIINYLESKNENQ